MRKKKLWNADCEEKNIPVSLVDTEKKTDDYQKEKLAERAAYFLLDGVPTFAVNKENGRYRLLASEADFLAVKGAGITQIPAKVYCFTEKDAEIFTILSRAKDPNVGAMEEAYLYGRLCKEFAFKQDDVAVLVGKSRPAIANTMRLLSLEPEVVGLVESGRLSAGHARTLVKVPKDKQYAFAMEALKRDYSVRKMERAVKAFLTPPEVLAMEKKDANEAKSAELKEFVERMRKVFRTKVSLIGNGKKGRVYIDYYSADDLYRFEELLDIIERFEEQ
ncbi:MAG: ParB/RepB/Spo0J family partition protein [Clostridiales bacterium]|nr:ParB/RepB/Spo0J family partition protein [Clostridiales bacterium]